MTEMAADMFAEIERLVPAAGAEQDTVTRDGVVVPNARQHPVAAGYAQTTGLRLRQGESR